MSSSMLAAQKVTHILRCIKRIVQQVKKKYSVLLLSYDPTWNTVSSSGASRHGPEEAMKVVTGLEHLSYKGGLRELRCLPWRKEGSMENFEWLSSI